MGLCEVWMEVCVCCSFVCETYYLDLDEETIVLF